MTMPPKKGMQRGTKASLVTVVMTFEGFLKSCLQKILSNDENGTEFLKLQQETALLSPSYYNKLAGNTTERKVAALIEKARNANEEQVLKLLDFIKDKLGDNASLRIFKHQILNRPMIRDLPLTRTRSRLDSAMARHMEKSEVLMDRFKLTIQEAVTLRDENIDLKEQMPHFREVYMALEKTKKETRELAEQLKLEKERLVAQKRITRKYIAEADRQQERADAQEKRADNLETKLEDQAKELEKKNIELEEYKNKLNDVMQEIGGLKGEMKDVKQQLEEVKDDNTCLKDDNKCLKDDNKFLRKENKEILAGLAVMQTAVSALTRKAQEEQSRFQLGIAHTSLDRHLLSLPSGGRRGGAVLPPITQKNVWK